MQPRDQAAEDVSFSIKHSHPASYNGNGNAKIGALLEFGLFLCSLSEIMIVFIGLHGISGE
jgi:hypothetical protein